MNDSEAEELREALAELQAAIHARRAALGDPQDAYQFDPVMRVRETQVVNPHQPIGWPVMPAGLLAKVRAYTQKITRRFLRWYINPIVAQQNQYNAAAADLMTSLQIHVDELLQQNTGLRRRHEQDVEMLSLRLQRLELARAAEQSVQPVGSRPPDVPIDYFLLGARFRNRVQMAGWLADYDDLWLRLKRVLNEKQTPMSPILDIGCGRGEYVEHLLDLGLPAYGIDLDRAALAIGQARGLDLRAQDAFEHLDALPDATLSAVVMIQVIEHLKPQSLLNLLRVIAQKLIPGGFILAETINPSCLYALSNWYLIDPSHETPVHTEMARFLLEQAGFQSIEIRFLHPTPPEVQLQPVLTGQPLPGDGVQLLAQRLQPNIDRLNQMLFGPQDYGVIGYNQGDRHTGKD